jgi:parkin
MSFIINFLWKVLQSMLQLRSFGKRTISNSLSVYIKTNTGSTLSVDLDPKWHIKNVKEIVAPRLGLSPEEVKIIFAGKELHDLIVIEVIFCLPASPFLCPVWFT